MTGLFLCGNIPETAEKWGKHPPGRLVKKITI